MNYTNLTDEELNEIAIEEEFLLFCSQDEFNDIARHIEWVVLTKYSKIID